MSELLDQPITKSFIPNKVTQLHEFNMLLSRVSNLVADHFGIDNFVSGDGRLVETKGERIERLIYARFIDSDYKNYRIGYNENNNVLNSVNNSVTHQIINNKWIIAFEGIDATGKQTLSGLLNDYFRYVYESINDVTYSEEFPDNYKISNKTNIPDYDLESGQEIERILKKGNYDPELLQIKFALNRKEVQNRINLLNSIPYKSINQNNMRVATPNTNNIQIFDRWVDSGAMYKLSKAVYNDLKPIILLRNGYSDKEFEDIIFKNKELFEKQIILEHTILELARPHLKILCTTPIEIISKRILDRARANGIKDEDLDSHEKDTNFLKITQDVYTYIYTNNKLFFDKEIFSSHYKNFKVIDTYQNNFEECLMIILVSLINHFDISGITHLKSI